MADTPTQSAESYFRGAQQALNHAAILETGERKLTKICYAFGDLAVGLVNLSVGLRATYQKLEEIEKLIKRQGSSPFR